MGCKANRLVRDAKIEPIFYSPRSVSDLWHSIDFHTSHQVLTPPSLAKSANCRTAQLNSGKTGSRRHVDTGVMIADSVYSPFDSQRHAHALAPMNWLHAHYKISNDDKLYTLSTFVTGPQQWLEKYDWRPLTEREVAVYPPNALILMARHGGLSGGK